MLELLRLDLGFVLFPLDDVSEELLWRDDFVPLVFLSLPLELLQYGLLVFSGLKVEEFIESSVKSLSDSGLYTFEQFNEKLLKVKVVQLMLSHL